MRRQNIFGHPLPVFLFFLKKIKTTFLKAKENNKQQTTITRM